MRTIYFKSNLNLDLENLFKRGLSAYSIINGSSGRPDKVIFKLCDGKIFKIQSTLIDLEDWDELGTLEFSFVDSAENLKVLDQTWNKIVKVFVLAIREPNVECQCGLTIENILGEKLYITPSSFPFSIELKSNFYNGSFEPECELHDYSSYSLTS